MPASGSVSGLGKIALVVKREYIERVRTKAFILSTILVPVFLGAVMFAPFLLQRLSPMKPLKIAVVDETGGVYQALDQNLASDKEKDFIQPKARRGEPAGEPIRRFQLEQAPGAEAVAGAAATAELTKRVDDGTLDAYLVIPKDVVAGKAEPTYYGRTVSDIDSLRRIERSLSDVLVSQRLSTEGVDATKVKELTRRVDLQTIKLGAKGEQSKKGFIEEWLITMLYVILLYTNLILYGSALARGLIEEKMNRVVEVLLSSLTPFQLMAGKIAGIGAAGLTQFLIWAGAALGFSIYRGRAGGDNAITVEPATLGFFVLYFLLGYFLYAALFCIVGAACTTEQEAQSAQQPVVMLLVVPMVIAIMIIQQPGGTLARVMSHIPFFSPIVMFMRINVLPPPAWEIAVNFAVVTATILLVAWLAARVFRVGILMTGKRATIPEIIRWVRTT